MVGDHLGDGATAGERAAAGPARDRATRRALGRRLRDVRLDRGWTLREAAERAGLSHTFIRKIEQGESEIAISRLIRLADGYGLMVADLLDPPSGDRGAAEPELSRSEQRRSLSAAGPGVSIDYLSSSAWPMQPFSVCLPPHSALENLVHPGTEFLHCTAGQPTLVVAGATYRLAVGDTLFIPDRTVHSYFNPHRQPARMVGAVHRRGHRA